LLHLQFLIVSTPQLDFDRILALIDLHFDANFDHPIGGSGPDEMFARRDRNDLGVVGLERVHGLPIELPVAVHVGFYKQRTTGLCPCERREAKAKEKKGQATNVFHENLTFLKNPALAGRPEKQDQKTAKLFFQCSTFNANRAKIKYVKSLAKLPFGIANHKRQSPQGLKPRSFQSTYGTTKVVP
jgi:hypothetical protein